MKTLLITLFSFLSLSAHAEDYYNAVGAGDVYFREAKPYVPESQTSARIHGVVLSWVNSPQLRHQVGDYFGVHLPGLGRHLHTVLKTNALSNLQGALRSACDSRALIYQRGLGADDGLVEPSMLTIKIESQGEPKCGFDRSGKYDGEVGEPSEGSVRNEQCVIPVDFTCSYPAKKLIKPQPSSASSDFSSASLAPPAADGPESFSSAQ